MMPITMYRRRTQPPARIVAKDPESRDLATLGIATCEVLRYYYLSEQHGTGIAGRWLDVQYDIMEGDPTPDLETRLWTANGMRDLARIYPWIARTILPVADEVELRAWNDKRASMGLPPWTCLP